MMPLPPRPTRTESLFPYTPCFLSKSGPLTGAGGRTSQFENHIRAVCGLPLGAVDRVASGVEMVNLIGGDVHDWLTTLADPNAHLHLYGKCEARPGRKMGHVTRLEFLAEATPPSSLPPGGREAGAAGRPSPSRRRSPRSGRWSGCRAGRPNLDRRRSTRGT